MYPMQQQSAKNVNKPRLCSTHNAEITQYHTISKSESLNTAQGNVMLYICVCLSHGSLKTEQLPHYMSVTAVLKHDC